MPRSACRLGVAVASLAVCSAACSTPPSAFSVERARAHVRMLAERIGSRPAGTEPNRRARQYVIDTLRGYGFEVRVQEADGLRPQYGASAHVSNIIASRPGKQPWALALASHYDSVPDGPGAADDGLGVAVCLEAGRVLAARPHPNYALIILVSDGEELGLMGATALIKDPVRNWIRGVLNFEAIGAAGPALLFEAAPGSGSMIDAWATAAPRPAGASFMTDIYKRLPNDTDMTMFARAGLPGLNFALVNDSYAYHTSRDTFERLDLDAIRQMGENTVATMEALDAAPLPSREVQGGRPVFFDVLQSRAIAYGAKGDLAVLVVALMFALFGWIQTLSVVRHIGALARVPGTFAWAIVSAAGALAAMLGGAWLLRATRESYHPWFAHPDRFYLFEIIVFFGAVWMLVRAGAWLARRLPGWLRGSAHPAVAWLLVLPFWAALAVVTRLLLPGGVHLVALPLAAAGLVTASLSTRRVVATRVGAAIVLGFAATLWLPNARLLLHFIVPMLGRAPIVTPVWLYPVLLLFFAIFLAPPLLILVAGAPDSGRRPQASAWGPPDPSLKAGAYDYDRQAAQSRSTRAFAIVIHPGSLWLSATVLVFAWCWFSTAYTHERPLEQQVRYVRDLRAPGAWWEVGSHEPGPATGATTAVSTPFLPVSGPLVAGTPLDQIRAPFVFRAPASVDAAPPLKVSGTMDCGADVCQATITAVPTVDGLIAIFALPRGVIPEENSLRGIVERGSFRAIYGAVPAGGITFRGRMDRNDCAAMMSATVLAVANGVPGAEWPHLPSWLPQEHATWNARSYFVLPVAFDTGSRPGPCSSGTQ